MIKEKECKILVLGNSGSIPEGIDNYDFEDDTSIYGYDFIFINYHRLIRDCMEEERIIKDQSINYYLNKDWLNEIITTWKEKFFNVLEKGTSIYIFDICDLTDDVVDHFLSKTFNINVSIEPLYGTNIDYENPLLEEFLTELDADDRQFRVEFTDFNCIPLARVSTTNKVVSIYKQIKNSPVVLLPYFDPLFINKKANKKLLLDFDKSLRATDNKLPKWTNNYFLPYEKKSVKKITSIEKQLSTLKIELDKQHNNLKTIQSEKALFALQGIPLEKKVESIFEELGFVIEPQTNNNRADIIMSYESNHIVVEVKGLKKSAGEKNAAQLEKWISQYYVNNGIHPKGMLIVNGFREMPIIDRTNEVFPRQMLGYCENREICLISSLQLLCMAIDIRNNPSIKSSLINKLLQTTGIFEEYKNWQNYIKVED